MLQQHGQDVQRLVLQADSSALLDELTRAEIHFERPETGGPD